MRQVGLLIEAFDGLHRFLAAFVGALQEHIEFRFRHPLQPQRAAQIPAHFGDRERGDVFAARALRHPIDELSHDNAVALCKRKGQFPLWRQ